MSAPITRRELAELELTSAAMQLTGCTPAEENRGRILSRALNELQHLRAECGRCKECGEQLLYSARQTGTGLCDPCRR